MFLSHSAPEREAIKGGQYLQTTIESKAVNVRSATMQWQNTPSSTAFITGHGLPRRRHPAHRIKVICPR